MADNKIDELRASTTGAVAIITGGGKGIGYAIARRMNEAGYRLGIIYNNSEREAQQLVSELNSDGRLMAIAVQCDARSMDNIRDSVASIVQLFGRVDVLINNSGIGGSGMLMDTDYKTWRDIIKVNLDSVYMYCHECLPHMLSRGGSIVNISSVWGVYGGSCEVAYSASKSGINGLTRALSIEMGGSNIRVNAVAPGFIKTDMTSEYTESDIDDIASRTALRRVGTASEVAEAVYFLASERASFVTGVVLEVSGGFKG